MKESGAIYHFFFFKNTNKIICLFIKRGNIFCINININYNWIAIHNNYLKNLFKQQNLNSRVPGFQLIILMKYYEYKGEDFYFYKSQFYFSCYKKVMDHQTL
jgi:hypothetical protein